MVIVSIVFTVSILLTVILVSIMFTVFIPCVCSKMYFENITGFLSAVQS